MARLLDWPEGLGITSIQPLGGPRTLNAASGQGYGAYTQTTSAIGFLWEFQLAFPPMRFAEARSFRGWAMAMHGGANATRFPFIGGDELTHADLGIVNVDGTLWSNGEPWEAGETWETSLPRVEMTVAVSEGDTEVILPDEHWGHLLDIGVYFGFTPDYFGVHMVTEVIETGRYRIFPPLRKDIEIGDYATLKPVLAVRLKGPDAISVPRNASFIEGATAIFVEVTDYDVRDFFTD